MNKIPTKHFCYCGKLCSYSHSKKKVLQNGQFNPNFNRGYFFCSSSRNNIGLPFCDYFEWDEHVELTRHPNRFIEQGKNEANIECQQQRGNQEKIVVIEQYIPEPKEETKD